MRVYAVRAAVVLGLALAVPAAALAQSMPAGQPAVDPGAPGRIGPSFDCSKAGDHPLAQARRTPGL